MTMRAPGSPLAEYPFAQNIFVGQMRRAVRTYIRNRARRCESNTHFLFLLRAKAA
jgi:hypothetical protein